MPRRDPPLASTLFGVGCAMVIGAPLAAGRVVHRQQLPGLRPAVAQHHRDPGPGGPAASPQRDAQEADPPSTAQFFA